MQNILSEPITNLYLEVGHGLAPAALNGQRRFTGNSAYLGVDKADGNYARVDGVSYGEQVSQQMAKIAAQLAKEKPDENISFKQRDGRYLPLQDATVTEVYMANLLTAPILRTHKCELLAEAKRVLRPLSKLVIKMSWDPEWLAPQYQTLDWLKDASFDIDEVIGADTNAERFAQLEGLYGPSQHQNSDSYYVIARK